VKWADARGPRDAPKIQDLARSQLVLSKPGMVLNAGALRVLLILRDVVFSTWPRPKGVAGRRKGSKASAASRPAPCPATRLRAVPASRLR
jgi:hypothetical protein